MVTVSIQDGIEGRTGTFRIIEPTLAGTKEFGHRYGCELLEVSRESIDALLSGKAWAFEVNGGEYAHFVVLKKEKST